MLVVGRWRPLKYAVNCVCQSCLKIKTAMDPIELRTEKSDRQLLSWTEIVELWNTTVVEELNS